MPAALYDIPDPRDRAEQYRQSAISTYGMQTPNIGGAPPKTIGGGLSNAMGGAATGVGIGSMMEASSLMGFGVGGAVVGAASYFLS